MPKWGSENFLAMVCTADCLPVDRLVITGGQEIYTLSGQPAHDLRGAHPKNLAIDLGIASNPALNKLDGTVLMCAAKCGYTHGMRHGPQDHFHLQIGPALSVPPIMVR